MGSSPEGELCPVCAQQPAGCCTSLVAPSAASQAWLRVTEAVKPQLSSPAVLRTFLVGLLHSGLKRTRSGVINYDISYIPQWCLPVGAVQDASFQQSSACHLSANGV